MKNFDFLWFDEFVASIASEWRYLSNKDRLTYTTVVLAAVLSILSLSSDLIQLAGMPKKIIEFYNEVLTYLLRLINAPYIPALKFIISSLIIYFWLRSAIVRSVNYILSKHGVERVRKNYKNRLLEDPEIEDKHVEGIVKLRVDDIIKLDETLENEIFERSRFYISNPLIVLISVFAFIHSDASLIYREFDFKPLLFIFLIFIHSCFFIRSIRSGINSKNPFVSTVLKRVCWEVLLIIFLTYFVAKVSVLYV